MELVVIRHGMTEGNREHRYVGRTDEPLCEEGIQQAREVTSNPDVKKVYVSPLKRACQTARILFPNATQVVVDGLQEMDFGDFESSNYEELADSSEYRAWVDGMCEAPCPNGEDKASFTKRTVDSAIRLLQEASERNEEQVVVVAHGGTVMALFHELCVDDDRTYFEWSVKNCEGRKAQVTFEEGAPKLTGTSMW